MNDPKRPVRRAFFLSVRFLSPLAALAKAAYHCPMWMDLPKDQKALYKELILRFAEFSVLFSQKSDDNDGSVAPIVNSKFQETAFQRSFHATAEDIGNTSFDASLKVWRQDGTVLKFLVGIKTFGFASGFQKIAQFKDYCQNDDIRNIITQIVSNASGCDSENAVNEANKNLYVELAGKLACERNMRIDSSIANLRGFTVSEGDLNVFSVYHVLMPSNRNAPEPFINVGETDYSKIRIGDIKSLGCNTKSKPANFKFTDGTHEYEFTAADSQLLMKFNNRNITVESWPVTFATDALSEFLGHPVDFPDEAPLVTESHSWMLTNSDGEIEKYSGFNSFYGVGSKISRNSRASRIETLRNKYACSVPAPLLSDVCEKLKLFLLRDASRAEKERVRQEAKALIANSDGAFRNEVLKLMFRPLNELYIPIPNAAEFHHAFPDFFAPGAGSLIPGSAKLAKPKEDRAFNLVFEPSGDGIRSFITQDFGKGIESVESQSVLGEWLLRGVFRLEPYEPVTAAKLARIGINAVRLYKTAATPDVHLEFFWINPENPPEDMFRP